MEYKEIRKPKGNLRTAFNEPRRPCEGCNHTYHNGKVYRITIHLRDGTSIESYFGWMYRERSKKVVQRVEQKLYEFIRELNKAIP